MTGFARAISHHGEILQGCFADTDGTVRRALVTLPRHDVRSAARITLRDEPVLSVRPPWKSKAKRAVDLTLREMGASRRGGVLEIRSSIPVGQGLGSSSSDVVATIRATAQALGEPIDDVTTARIAVAAEGATDSVMFNDRTVLFAQRDGVVLRTLGRSLPALDVVGLNTDSAGTLVLTLDMVLPEYTSRELAAFQTLLDRVSAGIAHRSAAVIGEVSTASARLNQRHLPVAILADLEAVAERTGAVGVQVAHSGTIAGLLYDSGHEDVRRRVAMGRRALATAGIRTWHFRTGGGSAE